MKITVLSETPIGKEGGTVAVSAHAHAKLTEFAHMLYQQTSKADIQAIIELIRLSPLGPKALGEASFEVDVDVIIAYESGPNQSHMRKDVRRAVVLGSIDPRAVNAEAERVLTAISNVLTGLALDCGRVQNVLARYAEAALL